MKVKSLSWGEKLLAPGSTLRQGRKIKMHFLGGVWASGAMSWTLDPSHLVLQNVSCAFVIDHRIDLANFQKFEMCSMCF